MNGFLDKLEAELIDATQRNAAPADAGARAGSGAGVQTGRHWILARPLRVISLATSLVLALTAVALAATGVLSTGAPVKSTPHLKPRAGIGIPRPGRSRLIAHSVPDPDGGPPWSMRIVRTTRGEVCLQVGRLYKGRLGVLGEDGSFHDDGRFHPLPPDALGQPTECQPRGVTSSQEIKGMTASGQLPSEGIGRPRQERRLYFGLLGPHAISVTYRADGRLKTLPVERGTGAYLIVLPAKGLSPKVTTWGAGFGYPKRMQARVRATPPLTRIAYETAGGTCVEGYIRPVAHDPCPRESVGAAVRRATLPPRDLHVPIEVRLQPMPHGSNGGVRFKGGDRAPGAIDGTYYEALISFKAPFAVGNADSGYMLDTGGFDCSAKAQGRPRPKTIPGAGPVVGEAIERNIRKGSVVHVRSPDVFANDKCTNPVTIEVTYHNLLAAPSPIGLVVGSTTVKEP